jgi:aminopeptidase N
MAYKGNSGGSVNVEIEFDKLFGLKFWTLQDFLRLKTYLFGDIGVINYNTIYEDLLFTDIRADAGIGAALTIKKWGPLDLVKPLTIRFDVPFFLNRPPSEDDSFLQFRWIMGISRAF